MIEMGSSGLQVSRRGKTRKGLEVVDEMGLIVVAARGGDVGPIDLPLAMDPLHHVLETGDTAKQLRRQADLVAEYLNEAPLAPAAARDYLGDRRRQ